MMSRRRFLGVAGGVTAGAVGGSLVWEQLLRDHVDNAVNASPSATTAVGATPMSPAGGAAALASRVLVIVQMGGGNDGLNTLVPVGAQAGAGLYRDARAGIALPESGLHLVKASGYALHPSLARLQQRFDAGSVVAFEGIAMPDQTRSHFTAMDTWWSATPGVSSSTGWVGRWLDRTEGATVNPLRAISLGGGSPALVGERALPTVVLDPAAFSLRAPKGSDAKTISAAFAATAQPLARDPQLAAAQQAVPSALDAIALFDSVKQKSTAAGLTLDAPANSIAALLQSAAGVIELGLGTRVLLVSVSGFDTHSDQLARQKTLLDDLDTGIGAFFDRLEKAGKANEVLLMTTSEFGRRVTQNASGGTDHGEGSVQFTMGAGVKGGRVVGELDLAHLADGDVPASIDTRSLYAVALDWLGGPTDEVLGKSFDRYGVL
jgi:uncharacterized protein (DUF1501 family)